MSRFSSARQFLERKAQQKTENNSVDALIKRAQLNELGYDVQQKPSMLGGVFGGGQTLVRDPNFVSTKALERKKLQNELDPNYAATVAANKEKALMGARKEFYGGSGVMGGANGGQFIIGPGGKPTKNPDYFSEEKERKKQDIKREYEITKPLSDTGASKLSAAQQSLENIQNVRAMATPEKFKNLKSGFSKVMLGNKLGINNPESVMGSVIRSLPVVGPLAHLPFKTTDEQKQFENNISTLIEGQLRARTGAAAPQQEIDREVSRILSSDDSLQSFLNKLSNAEKFVLGISEGIRPGSTKKMGKRSEVAVPEWVPEGDEEFYLSEISAGTPQEEIQTFFIKKKAVS